MPMAFLVFLDEMTIPTLVFSSDGEVVSCCLLDMMEQQGFTKVFCKIFPSSVVQSKSSQIFIYNKIATYNTIKVLSKPCLKPIDKEAVFNRGEGEREGGY